MINKQLPKYSIRLDKTIIAEDEDDAIEWLADHIRNQWDVPLRVERIEDEDKNEHLKLPKPAKVATTQESEKQIKNKDKPWLFQPGQSGNPKGRPPKGFSITESVKALLDENPEVKQVITEKIVAMAKAGDIQTIRTLWAYMDGMPQQKTDVTSGGKPIPILGGKSNVPINDSNTEATEAA